MTKGIQIRRGTTSQHSSFTGREGEITVDTTKQVVVVHDNLTAGGYPLVSETLPQTVRNKTVIAGSSSTTGTASQPLQVVGGAYVSGNLGVGVTNPSNKLEVNGQVHIYSSTDDYVKLLNDAGSIEISRSSGDAYIDLKNSNSEDFDARIQSKGSTGTLRLQGATDVEVVAGSATGLYVVNTGRVGVGTTIPTGDLQVGTGITMSATSGIISATTLRPAGGTTATAPIQFTTGTNLSAVAAGSLEYDGTTLNFTPDTNYGRASVPTAIYTSGAGTILTLQAEATDQVLFPSANDTISLPIGTYRIEFGISMQRAAGSTTAATLNVTLNGSGGGSAGTFSGLAVGSVGTNATPSATVVNGASITATTAVSASNNTVSSVYSVVFTGILRITTAGVFSPRYRLSANLVSATGANSINAANYMIIQNLATSGSSVATGGWA